MPGRPHGTQVYVQQRFTLKAAEVMLAAVHSAAKSEEDRTTRAQLLTAAAKLAAAIENPVYVRLHNPQAAPTSGKL